MRRVDLFKVLLTIQRMAGTHSAQQAKHVCGNLLKCMKCKSIESRNVIILSIVEGLKQNDSELVDLNHSHCAVVTELTDSNSLKSALISCLHSCV